MTRILEPHCRVVSIAIDGEDLLLRVAEVVPDVVITDIAMPGINGLDACRQIRQTYPSVRVIIVSDHIDEEVTASAFEVGATAAIRKVDMVEALPKALLAIS